MIPYVSIDLGARRVTVCEEQLVLTAKEYDLLVFLARNSGHVFNREELLSKVWGFNFFGEMRTVDTYIKQIRKKLKDKTSFEYIKTVWGVGYKFEAEFDKEQLS